MKKYVALLRGINVGGNNIIKMEALRNEFEKDGFQGVKTYIQSGNVIFQTDLTDKVEIEKKLEEMLSKRFDYKARVLVRSQKEMQNVVEHFPEIFEREDWKHSVIFLRGELDSKSVLKRFELKKDIEQLLYFKGVLFWSANMESITKSNMLKLSSREEYKEMTVRNINTTRKILALMEK